jgi:hypothetical protein
MSSFVCDILSHNIPFVFININLAGRIFFSEYVHVSYIIFILKRSFYNHFLKFLGLPIKFKKFVFLKSPHVHKKAREHLEIRWHRLNVFFSVFFILFDFSKYISLYGGNFSLLINRIEHDFKIL